MAGLVRIQTVVHLIKFGGYRQFNVPKPPLLLAANRCGQLGWLHGQIRLQRQNFWSTKNKNVNRHLRIDSLLLGDKLHNGCEGTARYIIWGVINIK